jgi:hypothetical protein
LVALALALAATAAAGSTVYSSALTITFRSKPSGDRFSGRVSSAKPACRRRKVIIFRRRSGADDRIRATRSRRGGAWTVLPPHRRIGAGRYYAVIRAKALPGGACAAVSTSSVVVTRH